MRLTPENIKSQEFSKSLRGYNTEEVEAYLEKLSSEIEDLINENEEIKEEIKNLNERVTEFIKMEKNMQDTLAKAKESSSRSLQSSQKQSELVIKEAEIKASEIIKKAKENADEIRDAVITLREEKDLIISKLRAMVNSQVNLFEGKVQTAGGEQEKPKKQKAKDEFNVDVDDIVDKLL
jgi:cell division initiation protein